MKNVLKKIAASVAAAAMSVSFCVCVNAEQKSTEEYLWDSVTAETTGPIRGKYSLGSKLSFYQESGASALENLYDGNYNTKTIYNYTRNTGVSGVLPQAEEDCYIEIDLGAVYQIEGLLVGINKDAHDKNRMARCFLAYRNTETGEWEKNKFDVSWGVDINWNYVNDDTVLSKKSVMIDSSFAGTNLTFGETVTDAIRVYPTCIAKSGTRLEIDELVVCGKKIEGQDYSADGENYSFNESSTENGLIKADYSLGFDGDEALLSDGKYYTGITGDTSGGEEGFAELSFGKRIFDISSVTVGIPSDETEKIPSEIRVEYYDCDEKEWIEYGNYTLSYTDESDVIKKKKTAQIPFAEEIETNGLRIYVTEAAAGTEYILSELVASGAFVKRLDYNRLEADYILGFALEYWSTNVATLGDGEFTGGVACNSVNYVNGVYGDDYHVLMTFGGKIANVNGIQIACNSGNFADQAVTSLRVDYLDPQTHKYVKGNEYTLSYQDVTKGKCAEIVFDTPVRTSILRIQVLTSYRTHRLFKISELQAFGTIEDICEQNPLFAAAVTAGGSSIAEMSDGDFVSAYSREKQDISAENPHVIEIDFGAEKYIAGFELMSADVDNYGIKDMFISYENNGEWYEVDKYSFSYDSARATKGYAIVSGDGEILAQKVRLNITDTYSPDGAFKINELRFNEADFSALKDYEQALKNFSLKKNYEYYRACLDLADSVPSDKKEQYMAEVNECKAELEAKQQLNVTYDISNEKAVVEGYIFCAEGNRSITLVPDTGEPFDADITVGRTGSITGTVSFENKGIDGDVTPEIVLSETEKLTGNTFTVRAAKTECELLSMSVDGRKVTLSESSGSVVLPSGSSLKGRIPVFAVSEGAKLYFADTEVISGASKLDLAASSVFKVCAEKSGIEKAYTVTVTVQSDGGGGSSSGNKGSGFSRPSSAAAVKPSENKTVFSDVSEDFWGYDGIMKLYDKGIVRGVSEGKFAPQQAVTRAEFVKMFLGVLGMESAEEAYTFADVKGHWCEGYINAAVKNKIVSGISQDAFAPDAFIKRQDVAVMLQNALKFGGKTTADFADDSDISDYAKEAVYILKGNGIISGYENKFSPADSLTRAEAASILSRLMN